MSDPLTPDQMRILIDKIVKEWADKGKIIEGGWQAFRFTQLRNGPDEQIAEMRKAYYLGAQHLFASIMTFLEPGTEETPQDMTRMDNIHKELEAFRLSLMH